MNFLVRVGFFVKSQERKGFYYKNCGHVHHYVHNYICVKFFLFSRLFVYETHCTVITEKTGELIKHEIVLLPLHRVKQSFF